MAVRACILQHAPFEGPGAIARWLRGQQAEVLGVHLYAGQSLPAPYGFDLVVVMGGPMSVHDEGLYPWLAEEKRFIRRAVEAGVRVLGVCLGAQLTANALGAAVYPAPHREIGWFPVTGREVSGCFAFPHQFMTFHWHGETFDLPPGAELLASTEACPHQAFEIGGQVLGLQFHLEVSAEDVALLARACTADLVPGPYVQTVDELMGTPELYAEAHGLMDRVLTYLSYGPGPGALWTSG